MARKLGPNMKHFLAYKVSRLAIPPGGGFAAGIDALTTPGRLAQLSRDALAWCDTAIQAMRATPDNPYGDDEEVIAAAILKEIEHKEGSK